MRASLLVVSVATLLGSCVTCTEIGCGSGASWSATAPQPVDYHGATVRACRNDVCASGVFPSSGPLSTLTLAPDVASAEIGGEATALGPSVEVGVSGPSGALVDGDRYRIEVRDATGDVIVSLAETAATYAIQQPNGPECGPTCRSVTLR